MTTNIFSRSSIKRVRNTVTLVTLLICAPTFSWASSVKQLTFEEVCAQAELIFEGHVISTESRQDSSHREISTYVTFEILDRIKGPNVGARIELRFPGGKVGDMELRVSDLHIPEPGETGVYFVESLDQQQFQPLVGWGQGHFVERLDKKGRAGIHSAEKIAVLEITPTKKSPSTTDHSGQIKAVSGKGAATNVVLAKTSSPETKPLSVRNFKAMIIDNISAGDVEVTQ